MAADFKIGKVKHGKNHLGRYAVNVIIIWFMVYIQVTSDHNLIVIWTILDL